MMKGYQSVRAATTNQDVIRQAESQIREAQRSISYFQEQIEALNSKRSSSGGDATSTPPSGAPRLGGGPNPIRTNSPAPSNASGAYGTTISSSNSSSAMGVSRPYGDSSSSYNSTSTSEASRFDQRPLPGVPNSEDSPYGYGGTDWQPVPINRVGTSARKNFTNLGECECEWGGEEEGSVGLKNPKAGALEMRLYFVGSDNLVSFSKAFSSTCF